MKKLITKKMKSKKLYRLGMYFDDDRIVNRIRKLSKAMGLSMSSAAGMIIRYGLPEVEKSSKKIMVEDEQIKNAK